MCEVMVSETTTTVKVFPHKKHWNLKLHNGGNGTIRYFNLDIFLILFSLNTKRVFHVHLSLKLDFNLLDQILHNEQYIPHKFQFCSDSVEL